MDLTNEQWLVLAPLFPERERQGSSGPRGGRPYRSAREVLDGIRWVLRTGAPWSEVPSRYPPSSTCHRRFQQWVRDGTLKRALHALAEHLRERGELDLDEAFIDGTHAGAKKGVPT